MTDNHTLITQCAICGAAIINGKHAAPCSSEIVKPREAEIADTTLSMMRGRIYELIGQRDALLTALRQITDEVNWTQSGYIGASVGMDDILTIASEAIAKIEATEQTT